MNVFGPILRGTGVEPLALSLSVLFGTLNSEAMEILYLKLAPTSVKVAVKSREIPVSDYWCIP